MSLVTPSRVGALVATLSLATALSACSADPSPPNAAPSAPSTPLASFPTEGLSVNRGSFCELVPPDEIETLLGGPVTTSSSYDNGERQRIVPGLKDVAHEFSCTWRAQGGSLVRAWVFAPPTTKAQARALTRSTVADAGPGCAKVLDAPDFGTPSVAVRCDRGKVSEVSFHGLFGDAWLSCSLVAPTKDAELVDRAGRWCVTAAKAASV